MYNDNDRNDIFSENTANGKQEEFEQPEINKQPDTAEKMDAVESSAENINTETPQSAESTYTKPAYTEPWKEPVYRVPPETTFSPSYHSQSYRYNADGSGYSGNTDTKEKSKKSKSGKGFLKAIALVLACAIVSTAASIATVTIMSKDEQPVNQVVLGSTETDKQSNSDAENDNNTTALSSGEMSSGDLYNMACEQVVGVNTSVTTTNIFGQASTSAVTGTGFIISEDGYILTNYHVIEYADQYGYELNVILADGTQHAAEIIGHEEDNDIAVVKIQASGLNAVKFGNSDDIQVGDKVYAVGNPLGELTYTMTDGIVSATNRIINTGASVSINMFQINAAVNSGNSGGPVYDASGKVIGVVTAKYAQSGVEGLGFAVPINDAYNIAKELIEYGYVSGKAYLGIEAIDVENYVSTYYGWPLGAYVANVTFGSCAENAGILKGDIITALGSTTITSVSDLKTALRSYSAGDSGTVTVYRYGEYIELDVVFDENTEAVNENQQSQQTQQTPQTPQTMIPQIG